MKSQKAFTFIELLVVITIIAVLMAIATVTYSSTMTKSRNAKRVADIQSIRSALEICRSEDGYYPTTINYGSGGVSCLSSVALTTTPLDPKNTGSYIYSYSRPTTLTYSISYLPEGGSLVTFNQP